MSSKEGEVRSLPYVLVLHAFCVVDPTLCAPTSDPSQFVVTLQPYLKSQVGFISGTCVKWKLLHSNLSKMVERVVFNLVVFCFRLIIE